MAQKLNRTAIAAQADVHEVLPIAHSEQVVDRTFELPAGLYIATVACYLIFLATTALAFSAPQLILPMVMFVFFIVAGFGIPTIWTKLSSGSRVKSMSWAKFQRHGIDCLAGHNTAAEATVQVLILPALIVVWGLAVVTIAAVVR
jgi:Flp pilus assembly protein TadB